MTLWRIQSSQRFESLCKTEWRFNEEIPINKKATNQSADVAMHYAIEVRTSIFSAYCNIYKHVLHPALWMGSLGIWRASISVI